MMTSEKRKKVNVSKPSGTSTVSSSSGTLLKEIKTPLLPILDKKDNKKAIDTLALEITRQVNMRDYAEAIKKIDAFEQKLLNKGSISPQVQESLAHMKKFISENQIIDDKTAALQKASQAESLTTIEETMAIVKNLVSTVTFSIAATIYTLVNNAFSAAENRILTIRTAAFETDLSSVISQFDFNGGNDKVNAFLSEMQARGLSVKAQDAFTRMKTFLSENKSIFEKADYLRQVASSKTSDAIDAEIAGIRDLMSKATTNMDASVRSFIDQVEIEARKYIGQNIIAATENDLSAIVNQLDFRKAMKLVNSFEQKSGKKGSNVQSPKSIERMRTFISENQTIYDEAKGVRKLLKSGSLEELQQSLDGLRKLMANATTRVVDSVLSDAEQAGLEAEQRVITLRYTAIEDEMTSMVNQFKFDEAMETFSAFEQEFQDKGLNQQIQDASDRITTFITENQAVYENADQLRQVVSSGSSATIVSEINELKELLASVTINLAISVRAFVNQAQNDADVYMALETLGSIKNEVPSFVEQFNFDGAMQRIVEFEQTLGEQKSSDAKLIQAIDHLKSFIRENQAIYAKAEYLRQGVEQKGAPASVLQELNILKGLVANSTTDIAASVRSVTEQVERDAEELLSNAKVEALEAEITPIVECLDFGGAMQRLTEIEQWTEQNGTDENIQTGIQRMKKFITENQEILASLEELKQALELGLIGNISQSITTMKNLVENVTTRVVNAIQATAEPFTTDAEQRLTVESSRMDKLKKLVKISEKLKISQLSQILGMDQTALYDRIIDWAAEYGFIIDEDIVRFDSGRKDDFIAAMDSEFSNWGKRIETKEEKLE